MSPIARPHSSPSLSKLTAKWTEYELVDSGGGKKLERFGNVMLVRPEAQAKWPAMMPRKTWEEADGEFVRGEIPRGPLKAGSSKIVERRGATRGQWKFRRDVPPKWEMRRGELRFWVQPTPSGHVGVFPDQGSHWDWMAGVIQGAQRRVRMLSLFGHTGLATLAAAAAGAEVTHVDASRQAVAWARENQALSGLEERPLRWIVEDALTFVRREARRGNRYEAMVIDPPQFGRGPRGQMWKLKESLPELLQACREVLTDEPVFVLLNLYVTVITARRVEHEAERVRECLAELAPARMKLATGDLGVEDRAGRRVVAAAFARASHA